MKKKTNALPKSQRESKRYFLFDKSCEVRKIKECFLYLYGALKYSESGFVIKSEKEKVIKINSDYVNELIFCNYYCNKINNTKNTILKVSGTIESLDVKL